MGYWASTRMKFKNRTALFYSLSSIFIIIIIIIFFFFFFFLCSFALHHTCQFSTNPCLVFRSQMMAAGKPDFLFQMFQGKIGNCITNGEGQGKEAEGTMSLVRMRRILSGLGSSPPRCAWKCGRCTPCKPVHVPVPPGTPVTTEYYPEAWRCKCGNRLYMP